MQGNHCELISFQMEKNNYRVHFTAWAYRLNYDRHACHTLSGPIFVWIRACGYNEGAPTGVNYSCNTVKC